MKEFIKKTTDQAKAAKDKVEGGVKERVNKFKTEHMGEAMILEGAGRVGIEYAKKHPVTAAATAAGMLSGAPILTALVGGVAEHAPKHNDAVKATSKVAGRMTRKFFGAALGKAKNVINQGIEIADEELQDRGIIQKTDKDAPIDIEEVTPTPEDDVKCRSQEDHLTDKVWNDQEAPEAHASEETTEDEPSLAEQLDAEKEEAESTVTKAKKTAAKKTPKKKAARKAPAKKTAKKTAKKGSAKAAMKAATAKTPAKKKAAKKSPAKKAAKKTTRKLQP